jgi:hypothetical protein
MRFAEKGLLDISPDGGIRVKLIEMVRKTGKLCIHKVRDGMGDSGAFVTVT